jgi:hypothetical protein
MKLKEKKTVAWLKEKDEPVAGTLAAALFEEETEAAPVCVEPARQLISPHVKGSEPAMEMQFQETQGAPLWAEPARQAVSLGTNGSEQHAETQFQETEATTLRSSWVRLVNHNWEVVLRYPASLVEIFENCLTNSEIGVNAGIGIWQEL